MPLHLLSRLHDFKNIPPLPCRKNRAQQNLYIGALPHLCMKKSISSILLAPLFFMLSVPSVLAQTIAEEWGRTAAAGIVSFLDTLKLNPTALSTVLLGILLWIILYSVVTKIGLGGESHWGAIGSAIIALIIVILSFMYLPANFVEALALQYGATGVAILAFGSFAILLYFSLSVSRSLTVARVIWIFFIVYYFAIFIYKIGTTQAAGAAWYDYIPYGASILAGILIVVFLPKMRDFVFKGELSAAEERGMRDISLRKLGREIEREEVKARLEGAEGGGV